MAEALRLLARALDARLSDIERELKQIHSRVNSLR